MTDAKRRQIRRRKLARALDRLERQRKQASRQYYATLDNLADDEARLTAELKNLWDGAAT